MHILAMAYPYTSSHTTEQVKRTTESCSYTHALLCCNHIIVGVYSSLWVCCKWLLPLSYMHSVVYDIAVSSFEYVHRNLEAYHFAFVKSPYSSLYFRHLIPAMCSSSE